MRIITDELLKRANNACGEDGGPELIDLINDLVDRIEDLTAGCDRLRKELENIADDCEAEYPPSHGAIKYAARMALKGE